MKKTRTTLERCEEISNSDTHLQTEEDGKENELHSTPPDGQTYELPYATIEVLDDVLIQQESNKFILLFSISPHIQIYFVSE
jgi:hypothetical protein